jgi:DDE superfamily endonuclease
MNYLQTLRQWVQKYSFRDVVYFDESGFMEHSYRPHGWATRGEKVHGKISGNNRKRTNLIMAQRGREWLAPMLFEKSCTHHTVIAWMKEMLIPELRPNSLIIMDNAPFHNKPEMQKLLEAHGHSMLPLPKYSPDFNPIEQSFAILKRRRQFNGQSIHDNLMSNYKLE